MTDYCVLLTNEDSECFVIDEGLKFFSEEEKVDNRYWHSTKTIIKVRARLNIECQRWLKGNCTDLCVYVYNKRSKSWTGFADVSIRRKGLSKTTDWTIEDLILNYESQVDTNDETLVSQLELFMKQVTRHIALNELL